MKHLFPIFQDRPDWIYFDTAATAHKPQCVIDTLSRFYASEYATVHRAVYRSALFATDAYHQARETVRAFMQAPSVEEIIFTRGTTDSLNLVALSYAANVLKSGDEILLSPLEHHSNLVPWQMVAKKTGAQLKWIPLDEKGNLLWENCIHAKTKILAVAHMSNVTGIIHPIREICQKAHQYGAIVVVDGAQAAPHLPINLEHLGCDFYAFSGHKCYGPSGIGVLFGRWSLLEMMPPIQGGGDMIDQVELSQTSYQLPPLRFEAGTPIIAGAIGLKTALDFLQSQDREALYVLEKSLLQRCQQNLSQIPRLKMLPGGSRQGGIVSFHVEGVHSLDLATLLDLQNIAVRSGHLCAQPGLRYFGLTSALRVSFGLYNTLQEVDRFAEILEQIVTQCSSSFNPSDLHPTAT